MEDLVWCTGCGEECFEKVIDDGIGTYDYGGAKGFHVDKYSVSSCCEAELSSVAPIDEAEYRGNDYGDDE